MGKIFKYIILLTVVVSCTKISDNHKGTFLAGSGVFILNEGNFTWGNGSLSFYSYDSAKIYNDLFLNINGRPLGDIPNSMAISGEKAYLVVNNSGKIEVIDRNTLESLTTIGGLVSPRNISFVNSTKAYVTSMYSDSVAILNLTDNQISGYISLRRSSEAIIISGNKAFISNWVGGREVIVINTINDKVVDSIEVGIEPESMVLDKNNFLWVLCNGGWARTDFAELIKINTVNNSIEKEFVFPTKLASPSSLQIDGSGETLYYLENGVKKMSIFSLTLPSLSYISQSGHYFYKIGINPVNSDIFVTDAVDYQQKGYVLYYRKDGTLVSTQMADVIPGLMCFKLNDNFQTQ
jgi:DNA-binding beta-propeller fold protein YncE